MGGSHEVMPIASLSSTLLARKGQARPAMRRQGYGGLSGIPGSQEDLGWNDMGATEQAAPSASAPAPGILPVPIQRDTSREGFALLELALGTAPVAHSALRVSRTIANKPVSVATATRIGRETARKHDAKGRTAFTLRLDQNRHLRLRLASATKNASAQKLVTEALDRFLQSLPDVEALLAQLPTTPKRGT